MNKEPFAAAHPFLICIDSDGCVFDTMEDLIACMLGSALLLLDYCCYLRRGRSPLMALVAAFDRANNYPGAAA